MMSGLRIAAVACLCTFLAALGPADAAARNPKKPIVQAKAKKKPQQKTKRPVQKASPAKKPAQPAKRGVAAKKTPPTTPMAPPKRPEAKPQAPAAPAEKPLPATQDPAPAQQTMGTLKACQKKGKVYLLADCEAELPPHLADDSAKRR